jgi:hypothetical protein
VNGPDFHPGEQLAILERTPVVLASLLRGTSPAWHDADEGPGTWSPRQVVGHLVHAEQTNWLPRARSIVASDAPCPFEPFDRFAHLERFSEWRLDDLLGRFGNLREDSLNAVRAWDLSGEIPSREGVHPALGPVTLRQLIATWVTHDLGHLAQIVRAMAMRNVDAVGPWREYLSILRP